MILWFFEAPFHPPYTPIVMLCGFTEKRHCCHSVSKKSTQKTFPPSEEKSFAPINNVYSTLVYPKAHCVGSLERAVLV